MFLIFFLLWILFNGRITWEIVLFGLAVSAVCYAVSCALLGFSFQKDLAFIKKLPCLFGLIGVLLVEIVKTNLTVIKMIYSKKKPKPVYTVFEAPLETDSARILLANCITLTPGTITGKTEDGKYTVHCLDGGMADKPDSSPFVKQLKKLEKKGDVR